MADGRGKAVQVREVGIQGSLSKGRTARADMSLAKSSSEGGSFANVLVVNGGGVVVLALRARSRIVKTVSGGGPCA